MAGIGIQLNRIFKKESVTSTIYGIGFTFTVTIAPMLLIILTIILMYTLLGFNYREYMERELFSSTVLYVFIFAYLVNSPFNSVLSKYQTDKIYELKYDDIQPCMIVGTTSIISLACLIGIPFYLYGIIVGNIPVYYIFTSFLCFVGLTLTFSTMIYNSILKQYKKISLFFFIGMVISLLSSLIFYHFLDLSTTYSMLLALTIGFYFIAVLELVNLLSYFPRNSRNYKEVFVYYNTYKKLMVANFFYALGLFIHNFVFWGQPWNLIVYKTYISNQSYDMASFIAMITNISTTIFFITKVEMHFFERYKTCMESIIGGTYNKIDTCKKRMFRSLGTCLMSLAQMQFIVSVVLFLIVIIVLPIIGISGIVVEIYPLLAVGYYVSFLMYGELLFLYYFDDLKGAAINSLIYCVVTFVGSMISANLSPMWHGLGFVLGALFAFTYSFFRLQWVEKNMEYHLFCRGNILRKNKGKIPDTRIYRK